MPPPSFFVINALFLIFLNEFRIISQKKMKIFLFLGINH